MNTLPRYIAENLGLDLTDLLAPRDEDTRIERRVRDAVADADTVWDLLRSWDQGELQPLVKVLRSTLVLWREAHVELGTAHATATRQLDSLSLENAARSVVRAEIAEARIHALSEVAQNLTEALRDFRTQPA